MNSLQSTPRLSAGPCNPETRHWLETYVPSLGECIPEGLAAEVSEESAMAALIARGEWPRRRQPVNSMWADPVVLAMFHDRPVTEVIAYSRG